MSPVHGGKGRRTTVGMVYEEMNFERGVKEKRSDGWWQW